MLFVLDNYDSFTYNLVQLFGELGAEPVVYRNDALTVEQVLALKPTAAVLSPGPCTPGEAGILVPLVKALAGKRSEEHTSELQSHSDLVCRLLLEKKKNRSRHTAETQST